MSQFQPSPRSLKLKTHLWCNNFPENLLTRIAPSLSLFHLTSKTNLPKPAKPSNTKDKGKERMIKSDTTYQFMFSDSALFFKIHLDTVPQSTGR